MISYLVVFGLAINFKMIISHSYIYKTYKIKKQKIALYNKVIRLHNKLLITANKLLSITSR